MHLKNVNETVRTSPLTVWLINRAGVRQGWRVQTRSPLGRPAVIDRLGSLNGTVVALVRQAWDLGEPQIRAQLRRAMVTLFGP